MVALALGLVVVAVGGYAVARLTSVFAVDTIEVTGAPPSVASAVERVAAEYRGESLVTLDRSEVRSRLLALPTVVAVRLDRAFPNTLEIRVRAERPAAVIRSGPTAWLVSERGRVIREVDPPANQGLPRVWLPSQARLAAGRTLVEGQQANAVRAAALVPAGFPLRVDTARSVEGELTFVLGNRAELRLGQPDELELKLAVAKRVLEALGPEGRAMLGYLDVSMPDRAVVGPNSQLEG
jgi:cell division protein FtsQ